jgi:hypothetical protein
VRVSRQLGRYTGDRFTVGDRAPGDIPGEMHHEQRPSGTAATPHRGREILTPPQAIL